MTFAPAGTFSLADKTKVARAYLALTVLEEPARFFASGTAGAVESQIAEELKFATLFDLAEEGDASSLNNAKEKRKSEASKAAGQLATKQ